MKFSIKEGHYVPEYFAFDGFKPSNSKKIPTFGQFLCQKKHILIIPGLSLQKAHWTADSDVAQYRSYFP